MAADLFDRRTSIAVVGELATMKCFTISPYVSFHVEDASGGWMRVAIGDIVMPRYRRAIRIRRRKRAEFDYVWYVFISRVKMTDAGRYQCLEHPRDDIFEQHARAARYDSHRLVVIASLPKCAVVTSSTISCDERHAFLLCAYNSSTHVDHAWRLVDALTRPGAVEHGVDAARGGTGGAQSGVEGSLSTAVIASRAGVGPASDYVAAGPPLDIGATLDNEETTMIREDRTTTSVTRVVVVIPRLLSSSAAAVVQFHLYPTNVPSETRVFYELPLDIIRAVRITGSYDYDDEDRLRRGAIDYVAIASRAGEGPAIASRAGEGPAIASRAGEGPAIASRATLRCERADGGDEKTISYRWIDEDTGARVNDGPETIFSVAGGRRVCVACNLLSEARATAYVEDSRGVIIAVEEEESDGVRVRTTVARVFNAPSSTVEDDDATLDGALPTALAEGNDDAPERALADNVVIFTIPVRATTSATVTVTGAQRAAGDPRSLLSSTTRAGTNPNVDGQRTTRWEEWVVAAMAIVNFIIVLAVCVCIVTGKRRRRGFPNTTARPEEQLALVEIITTTCDGVALADGGTGAAQHGVDAARGGSGGAGSVIAAITTPACRPVVVPMPRATSIV
jgi:hypothetical protein